MFFLYSVLYYLLTNFINSIFEHIILFFYTGDKKILDIHPMPLK